jgi:hypothetical protein
MDSARRCREPLECWTIPRIPAQSRSHRNALAAASDRIRDLADQFGVGGTIRVELRLLGGEMALDVGLIELNAEAVGDGGRDTALQPCRQQRFEVDRVGNGSWNSWNVGILVERSPAPLRRLHALCPVGYFRTFACAVTSRCAGDRWLHQINTIGRRSSLGLLGSRHANDDSYGVATLLGVALVAAAFGLSAQCTAGAET